MKTNIISIIGTGLIGGSIALGLRGKVKEIVGFDSNPRALDYAVKSGIIDYKATMDSICEMSDVIIVSVPVDVAITLIPEILSKSNEDTIIIDVSSTKEPICNILRNHPKRRNFVAAHPMAGSEIGGPQNADENLFIDHKVIICEFALSSKIAQIKAVNLFSILGLTIEEMNPETHDRVAAMVSHFPQVISYGIAKTISLSTKNEEWSAIASNGFDSSTRLAKSPADIWMPILFQNKKYIHGCLHLFIHEMEQLISLINNEDRDGLTEFIHQSNIVREKFENNIKNNCQNNGKESISRSRFSQFVATGIE